MRTVILTGVLLGPCSASSYGHMVARPDVHVQAELLPDLGGTCCTVVMVNPTHHAVYARCLVTLVGAAGDVVFFGDLATPPAGWYAPPGRHREGAAGVYGLPPLYLMERGNPLRLYAEGIAEALDTEGHLVRFRYQRLQTRCDAFVWKGQLPI